MYIQLSFIGSVFLIKQKQTKATLLDREFMLAKHFTYKKIFSTIKKIMTGLETKKIQKIFFRKVYNEKDKWTNKKRLQIINKIN